MSATEAQAGPVRGLDAAALGDILGAMLDLVRGHEDELNRLNVFPVRDHDTGTNMALTLEGVVKAVEATRGNSGTILSEALRGMFETWAPLDLVGPADLVRGFRAAADRAEQSVLNPVEGTILTVARVTADAMEELAPAELGTLLAAAAEAAGRAVQATTAQLPALRRAGVVDAAARGFELCVRAFAAAVAGEDGKAPTDGARAGRPAPSQGHPAAEAPGHAAGEPSPAFEVQYLLACGEADVRELERSLAPIGDSITVARGAGRCRVH